MWWKNRPALVPPAFVDRVRLRRAALRYVDRGWSVTPGACLAGSRFVCGRPGCPITSCHPALDDWQEAAGTDIARVAAWWHRRPHTVLLTTGGAFDVLEVPAALGLRVTAAAELRAAMIGRPDGGEPADGSRGDAADSGRGPVAVTPTGRWMFFVRPGAPLCTELDNRVDVVLHGPGSWIPAAPSRMPEGPVRWAVAPEQTRWIIPASETVQGMLVDALGALGRRTRTVAVPRQVSTSRRAA
jgi:hypothetical protein